MRDIGRPLALRYVQALAVSLDQARTGLHPASVVIWAGISAALHVGKIPPAIPLLHHELGMSLMQAGLMLSMVQFAGMVLGLLVGLGADHWGLRKCMLMGLSLMFFASCLGGLAPDATTLLVLRGVEGLGFLLVVTPAPALIRQNVAPGELSARMGGWGTYMSFGSALGLLLGPIVMGLWDRMTWWMAAGGVSLLAWLAVWAVVPRPLDRPALKSPPQKLAAAAGWRDRLVRTLTTPGPWMMAFAFAVYTGQWMSVIGFLPTIYTQNQISWGMTGVLTAIVALVNFSGNWMSGRLLQRGWSARLTMATGYGVMGLGALGAFWDWGGWQLPFAARYACVVLFSAVGGLIPGSLFACAVRLAPSEDTVSTTVGWMQQWSATGQFFGPLLVAWVAAAAGGWQWTWVVTLGMASVGLGLAWRIQQALDRKQGVGQSHA